MGLHEADLYILSNSTTPPDPLSPDNELYLDLTGFGVNAEPPPTTLMSQLIDQFEAWVAEGWIVGFGPGNSAEGRLGAFSNMLSAADDLIVASDIVLACEHLETASLRCDGVDRPPEFIDGTEKANLSAMISNVMTDLGCL